MAEQPNLWEGGGSNPTSPLHAYRLFGEDLDKAKQTIIVLHYTHSVPSGKSYYFRYDSAIVVFSIPANQNIAKFALGVEANVWELSRLWAPDGHRKNLLTQAISAAVAAFRKVEPTAQALVSYADPNVGHLGGVYKAASWIPLGQCEETRAYRGMSGEIVARRKFHSGSHSMRKAEIEALGYKELKLPGKWRFVKPLTKRASSLLAKKHPRATLRNPDSTV